MKKMKQIFPLKRLGRNLVWMFPAAALLPWLFQLDGSGYVTGEFWSTYLAFLGGLILLWIAARLSMWEKSERWKTYTHCPECGQKLTRETPKSD